MTENPPTPTKPQRAGIWVQKFDASDHEYVIGYKDAEDNLVETRIGFQRGAITEVGVNGITNEILLAILMDRLEGMQTGPCACDENAVALRCLKYGFDMLTQRFSQITHEALTELEDRGAGKGAYTPPVDEDTTRE